MKKLPKIIIQEEFEKFLVEALKIEQKLKLKSPRRKGIKQYRIAMLLGFEAGMRISEIVGFKDRVPALTKDRVESASIRITSGKGGKDRIVPRPKRLNQSAVDMLPLQLKRRALQDFVTKLGKRVLNKDISFHTLRHGFGSHLAGANRPLHEIQMLMGHSRLDTTGVYLHANPVKAIEGARDIF
ncbi:hypothetical protein LCGC14_2951320 [marine sediment metagenome]|uniref:Tyr recombinase domain-containing protein n=1 Tax=marine sediment metagenome TaxID=412755 RepID=A0A0F9A6C0_9ZZZZ